MSLLIIRLKKGMNLKNQLVIISMISIFVALFHANLSAEIYKYQDEIGKWHFTDKPKDGDVVKKSYSNNGSNSSADVDITEKLSGQINFNNPLEKATYSVVTVETNLGKGSAFFISEDCYLITNKHVVRPTSTQNWKKAEQEINDQKADIKKEKKYLSRETERLKINKRKLADFRDYVDSLRPSGHKNDEERRV